MKRKNKAASRATQRLAAAMVHKITALQIRWASFMQRHFEKLTVTGKKLVLALFCALTGTYSGCVIFESFTAKPTQIFSVSAIHMPQHIIKEAKEPTLQPAEELRHIEQFKDYMDTCAKFKDSLLRFRPGLRDSILEIEQIYKHQ